MTEDVNPHHDTWAYFKEATSRHRADVVLDDGAHTHVRMTGDNDLSWDVVTWPGHVVFAQLPETPQQTTGLRFTNVILQDRLADPVQLFQAGEVYSDGAPKLDPEAILNLLDEPDDHTFHDTDKVIAAVRAHLDTEGVTGRRRERALIDARSMHTGSAAFSWLMKDRLFRKAEPWRWNFRTFTDRFVMTCWAIHATLNHLQEKTP